MKKALLLLCHRLPWPPSKGDKIRSYHVLRRLAEHYRVYLGTFIDDSDDWRHVDAVKALCAEVCVRPLDKRQIRLRAFGALLRGEPLTVACYRDRTMQTWVDALVAEGRVDLALCYSSGVAVQVMHHAGLPRVMDFVDADSDKWRQYARSRHGLAHWLYAREARRLAAFERQVAGSFRASLLVSPAEAEFFRRRAEVPADKVHGIANGVDAEYWNPQLDFADPHPPGRRTVVFAGAMDYRANVDAVQWFVREVWPRVRAAQPAAHLCIVGSRPTREVKALAGPDITVTGRVEDVRPYVAHAHAVTAPLRIARGIQNKVLEALAMGKVVLATPEAWEGIEDFPGRQGCISAAPAELAAAALRHLAEARIEPVPEARAMVRAHYDWAHNLDAYEAVLRSALQPADACVSGQVAMEACP